MLFENQSARDFFDSVRHAAMEVARTERQLARMEASEGVRAQGYTPMGKGSRTDVNGTSATDARIDYEGMMRKRLEEDRALIDGACSILYGPDSRGGVAGLLGSATADAMWWRYCAAESWYKAADMASASVATVKRWCDVAFDMIDAAGFDAVRCGEGLAEG